MDGVVGVGFCAPKAGALSQGVPELAVDNNTNDWILRQCRAAAFYQAENWSALLAIEHVVEEAGEEGEWDVVGRFGGLPQRRGIKDELLMQP
jgi:hypothetical protein